MRSICFFCIVILGMVIPARGQGIWSESSDKIYINESDSGFRTVITYGVACFQCTMPDRVILLDVHARMSDTTLNKDVEIELLTPEIKGERLLDSIYVHYYQKVSYLLTIKKPIRGKEYKLKTTFDLKLERRAVIITNEYFYPSMENKKVIIVNPPLIEFYPNPDSSARNIPPFNGVKSFLVGSFVLKNNHPTKKLHVSFKKFDFTSADSWNYFAGVGQTEDMPSEVPPQTAVTFNFWMQLKNPKEGAEITPILFLECWYDDTIISAQSNGQMATLNGNFATGLNKFQSKEIKLYPNPCVEYIFVGSIEKPIIYTTLGEIIETESIYTENGWQLNTSNLPKGCYFIQKQKFFKE